MSSADHEGAALGMTSMVEAAPECFYRGESLALLTTQEAARLLRLQPQTLRLWACKQSGPIRPVYVGRVLRWLRADIDKLLRRAG